MEEKDHGSGELRVDSDERVTRLFRCSCGTPVYKKNLTNNTYEIPTRDRGQLCPTIIDSGEKCIIKCPNPACDLSHIVLTIKENITAVDKTKEEGVE